MIQNFNEIIKNKSFEKVDSLLVIRSKNFSSEIIQSHNLMSVAFAHLNFTECKFIDLDLRNTYFKDCTFERCSFKETLFLKAELKDCEFQNCQFFQSEIVKTNFTQNNFVNCQFNDVNMAGSDFCKCEWIKPKFHEVPTLKFVTLEESQICNSKKCVKVNWFDNVAKVVKSLEE